MVRDKFLAALACSACADALGDKFEFQHDIKPESVLAHINGTDKLEVTDDSQMTYFGMRALHTKLMHPKLAFKDLITDEYINWYRTQEGPPPTAGINRLIPPELFKRKSPGNACMRSMRSIFARRGQRAANDSRGCGSVMRILPFAANIVGYPTGLEYSLISASVTHDHPENALAVHRYNSFAERCMRLGVGAVRYAPDNVKQAKRITDLGMGFYAMEAVDMAIWAVINSSSLEELLLNSICHDGDSDSVGAIAGGLWGLMTEEMPPSVMLKRVKEWPILRDMGKELLDISDN